MNRMRGMQTKWCGRISQALYLLLLALFLAAEPLLACRIIDPRPIPIPLPTPRPGPVSLRPIETKEHKAEITVEGQMATIRVSALFHNPNSVRLEGTYFFPLPAEVAVDSFSMLVNGKEMKGELLDATRAREVYEEIVRRAQDPGLLEFVGMQMIKVRVFPIEANGEVAIRLSYRHLVERDGGLCRLRYPLASAKPEGEGRIGLTSLKVTLSGAAAIKNVYSPSHTAEIARPDDFHATVGYEATNLRPEQDFTLYWAEAAGEVGASLLTRAPAGEDGYFLLLLSPALELAEEEVGAKDVVFVLDRSGSMQEQGKMEQAKRALSFCLSKLRAKDRFGIVLFSTGTERFRPALTEATPEAIQEALAYVDRIEAVGGTTIEGGLREGLDLLAGGTNLPLLLFLTDGLPTVDETGVEPLLAKAKERNTRGARLFVFGVGHDVNARLLDRLADEGKGVREYVQPGEEMELKISNLYAKVASPVLTDLRVNYGGTRVYDSYPAELPDLFRGGQVTVMGRYSGSGTELRLTGKVNGREKSFTYPAAWGERKSADFLPTLWAMRKVGYLLDQIRLHGESKELKDEVTRLGQRYGIVTPYTSFLVVEEGAVTTPPPSGVLPIRPALEERLRAAEDSAKADFEREEVGARAQGASETASIYKGGLHAPAPALDAAAGGAGQYVARSIRSHLNEQEAEAVRAVPIRRVEGLTFFLRNGVWTDSRLEAKSWPEPREIAFLSEEYFRLLAEEPGLAKILAIGENIAVVWQGVVYRVTNEKR